MNTRLYHDGLQLERFYAEDVSDFGEQIFGMLSFAGHPINNDLSYADCKTQLLESFDGRILILFGGLNNVRNALQLSDWEELSIGICKLFYLHRVADFDGFAKTVHELDAAIGGAIRRKKTANDQ